MRRFVKRAIVRRTLRRLLRDGDLSRQQTDHVRAILSDLSKLNEFNERIDTFAAKAPAEIDIAKGGAPVLDWLWANRETLLAIAKLVWKLLRN